MWHQRQKELSEEEGSDGKPSGSGAAERRKDSRVGSKGSSQRGGTERLKSPLDPEIEHRDVRHANHATGRRQGKPLERASCSEDESPSEDDGDVSRSSGERAKGRRHQNRGRSAEKARPVSDHEAEQIGPSAPGEGDDARELELDEFLHSR